MARCNRCEDGVNGIVRCQYCDGLGNVPDDNDILSMDDDEPEFVRCSKCDGHDACEDFGCAFELGLGRMVKADNPFDW
jgi:hypothetical protein